MGLETVTYVSDLVATNPVSGDPKAQGDDHIRNIKAGLLASFAYTGKFYEEGTFTPAITLGGGSTGLTYTTRNGTYTKNGRVVTFRLYVLLSAKGSSTGAINITALPYTSLNTASIHTPVAMWWNGLTGITGQVQGFIQPGTSFVTVQYLGTGTDANVLDTNLTNTTEIMVSGSYFI